MSSAVHRREPDPNKLILLPTEEIAPYLFEQLYDSAPRPFSLKNIFLNNEVASDYPKESRPAICARLMEAFIYLEHTGMVMPNPASDSGWYTFSSTAKTLGTADALKSYFVKAHRAASTAYELAEKDAQDMRARMQAEIESAIQSAREEAKSIFQLAQQTAQGVSLDEVQKQFATAADECYTAVKLWAALSGIFVVFFVIIIVGFLNWWTPTFLGAAGEKGAPGSAIYQTVIRVTILTAVAAIATFCLRVFRAQMHMREQNLHRKRVANSMAAFLGAASSPEQRDVILGRVVDAITAFGNSGLLTDGDETMSPAKVILESIPRAISQK
jgi:hypothetical protein